MMAVDQAAFLRIALRGGRFMTSESHVEAKAKELGMQPDTVRQWLALVRRPKEGLLDREGRNSGDRIG
ncbi:MAG: hypothetical protein HQL63_09655 [Magnetococcales bacterium]|nr:hypothetical protein [Magnetococcales bacterium]MBF0322170.1 hypothetical protein [Magnetococcales bacterium]